MLAMVNRLVNRLELRLELVHDDGSRFNKSKQIMIINSRLVNTWLRRWSEAVLHGERF